MMSDKAGERVGVRKYSGVGIGGRCVTAKSNILEDIKNLIELMNVCDSYVQTAEGNDHEKLLRHMGSRCQPCE